MRSQIEGSRAVARAVALCRPEVICAYPISPQTHIVEALSELVGSGELHPCEYLNVESEFGAMSVAIGASAAGVRAYTATASQGLLFMAEALFNASGLGLPIVMTVANRAIGAPINIWNDHSDTMSLRDCGWLQLFATTNQEAADLHLLAFRLAEDLSVPVMVCMDGFILTHAVEEVDLPEQAQVDAYLPPFAELAERAKEAGVPRQVLDPEDPVSIGAMVGPEAFTEVRYLAHRTQLTALERIPVLARELSATLGRDVPGLVTPYKVDDAELVVVALGSVLGTLCDTIDELRQDGVRVGALAVNTYRPFPAAALRAALPDGARVLVVERAFAVGAGGIVTQDVRAALSGVDSSVPIHGSAHPKPITTVVAGLGGRPVLRASLTRMVRDALAERLEPITFLDLDTSLLDAELVGGGR